MRFRFFSMLMLGLLAASCSTEPVDPGLYLVQESGALSGVVDVIPSVGQNPVSLYFPDEKLLSSDWTPVKLTKSSSGTIWMNVGSKTRQVTLVPYDAPEFERKDKISLYLDPRYSFSVDQDVVFGTAKGYWVSYPDTHKNPVIIYWDKFKEVLWRQIGMDQRKDLDLTMDIYRPDDGGVDQRPLLLLIHGGAFLNGDKALENEGIVKWAEHFASLGYVVSSVNYRCGFLPTTNEVNRAGYRAVQDANAAVRYLLQDSTLRINPRLVFVAGSSAGGITAMNVAYMHEKNRPAVTTDPNSRYGDEGEIGSINPPAPMAFSIRAVGNLWGAVNDTTMLDNARIPVISFHGTGDPIVPYGEGVPFTNLLDNTYFNMIVDGLKALISIPASRLASGLFRMNVQRDDVERWLDEIKIQPFPTMYGSQVIDRVLKRKGVHSELYPYNENRHSLHVDDGDRIRQDVFTEIRDGLTAFFSSEMTPYPVSLHQDPDDPQLFHIDSTDVSAHSWKVDGGVVLDQGPDWIRVMMLKYRMFKSRTEYSVMVSGVYSSGMTFFEQVAPDMD